MRRSLLGMLLGLPLIGDGLVRPQNAPAAQQPAVGVQPGTTTPVVIANRVIVFGPSGTVTGVFVYSGTPGPGTLIASMTDSLTDPFGNATIQGVVSYAGPGAAAGIVNGALFLYTGSPLASYFSVGPGTLGRVQFGGVGFTSAGGTAAAPTVITTDTWHNASLTANFAAGAPAPQYLLLPDQSYVLRGQVSCSVASGAGTTMFTIPATFTQTAFFATPNTMAGYTAGSSTVSMNAGGSVTNQFAMGIGNTVRLDGCRNWLI